VSWQVDLVEKIAKNSIPANIRTKIVQTILAGKIKIEADLKNIGGKINAARRGCRKS
jgi:hypothetical protein